MRRHIVTSVGVLFVIAIPVLGQGQTITSSFSLDQNAGDNSGTTSTLTSLVQGKKWKVTDVVSNGKAGGVSSIHQYNFTWTTEGPTFQSILRKPPNGVTPSTRQQSRNTYLPQNESNNGSIQLTSPDGGNLGGTFVAGRWIPLQTAMAPYDSGDVVATLTDGALGDLVSFESSASPPDDNGNITITNTATNTSTMTMSVTWANISQTLDPGQSVSATVMVPAEAQIIEQDSTASINILDEDSSNIISASYLTAGSSPSTPASTNSATRAAIAGVVGFGLVIGALLTLKKLAASRAAA